MTLEHSSRSPTPPAKGLWQRLGSDSSWRPVFYIAAAGFFGLSIYLLATGKPAEAFVGLLGASAAGALSRMSDIVKFKLGKEGFETEMRAVIEEAKATVAQLHLLAAEQAKLVLESVYAEGRWGGRSTRSRDDARKRLLGVLRQLEIPESTIAEVDSVVHKFNRFDYANWVSKAVRMEDISRHQTRWNEFFAGKHRSAGVGSEPSPDELEAFLKEIDALSPEVLERLADYRHYEHTKTHRREEEWLNGG